MLPLWRGPVFTILDVDSDLSRLLFTSCPALSAMQASVRFNATAAVTNLCGYQLRISLLTRSHHSLLCSLSKPHHWIGWGYFTYSFSCIYQLVYLLFFVCIYKLVYNIKIVSSQQSQIDLIVKDSKGQREGHAFRRHQWHFVNFSYSNNKEATNIYI